MVDAIREVDCVGEVELFEEPDGADATRCLQEVDGYVGHGAHGGAVFGVVCYIGFTGHQTSWMLLLLLLFGGRERREGIWGNELFGSGVTPL